jgi:hypothetical protein
MAGERGNRLLRLLDKGLGVPLVLGLGILRGRRGCPKQLRRVGDRKSVV